MRAQPRSPGAPEFDASRVLPCPPGIATSALTQKHRTKRSSAGMCTLYLMAPLDSASRFQRRPALALKPTEFERRLSWFLLNRRRSKPCKIFISRFEGGCRVGFSAGSDHISTWSEDIAELSPRLPPRGGADRLNPRKGGASPFFRKLFSNADLTPADEAFTCY